jgi:putative ABC transport system permease protein
MIYLKLLGESFLFAMGALRANLLRTILSLVGVTIGILLIISVLTIVDSLEKGIKDSFSFLGSDNISVDKWPITFDGPYPWWKYINRPIPSYEEFEFLRENSKSAQSMSMVITKGGQTVKFDNNEAINVAVVGITFEHAEVYELQFEEGRYFQREEVEMGKKVVIIGHRLAKDLFGDRSALSEQIRIRGIKHYIVGVLKEEGASILGTPSNDDNAYIPFKSFERLWSVKNVGFFQEPSFVAKGFDSDEGLVELEAELNGLMRKKRGLRPKETNDFALNRPEAISNVVGSTFKILRVSGWFIGGFAILVGAFGTANIMFVSVRERTHIIGIQKSLGAKNYFILFQFLFESVFLCLIGGGIGLFFVFLLSLVSLGSLDLILSWGNILMGIGLSTFIGVLAGIIPAIQASRMDPVIAIRTQ